MLNVVTKSVEVNRLHRTSSRRGTEQCSVSTMTFNRSDIEPLEEGDEIDEKVEEEEVQRECV